MKAGLRVPIRKFLIWTIFILTAVDYILTRYGLIIGDITEGNPLLSTIMKSDWLTAGLLIAVGLALIFIARLRKRWVYISLWIILSSRLAAMGLHLRWLF